MDRRLQLSEKLRDILGSTNVYFQPPSNLSMSFPAIVYERSTADIKHADNRVYSSRVRYSVTLIARDPEHPAFYKLMLEPLCLFDRHFVADDLNHDVFNIYF